MKFHSQLVAALFLVTALHAEPFRIYFAGEMFDHKHLAGNVMLAQAIEKASNGQLSCNLPQDQAGQLSSRAYARNLCIKDLIEADVALFNFDGTDLDSGTVAEFMLAKMLDIPAVIVRTDFRSAGDFNDKDPEQWNLMCSGYPRTAIVTCHSLACYRSHGLNALIDIIAHEIINATQHAIAQPSLSTQPAHLHALYAHVLHACGSQVDRCMTAKQLQSTIESKIARGIYYDKVTADEPILVSNY